MARTEKHKLILRYPYRGVVFPGELYDMQKDLRETVNIYADPALASVVKDLTKQTDAFFSRYTAPGRSGLNLETQKPCNNGQSPWSRAAKQPPDRP